MRVVVVGARRARQGLGAFVARAFHRLGATVTAVVGTRPETVAAARGDLARSGITLRGYTSLEEALEKEKPQAVALCTPIEVHRQQLEAVAAAGAHCLCEKPLWWGAGGAETRRRETERLVQAFLARGRLLMLMTQWPETLPAYFQLYPEKRGRPPVRFRMRLSPVSVGARMVLDAAPHVLSMLVALCGPGRVAAARAVFPRRGRDWMELRFLYRHGAGTTLVEMELRRVLTPPRPAGYGLDGAWVERQVGLPAYRQRFVGARGAVPIPDPLTRRVARFLSGVRRGAATDAAGLLAAQTELEPLVAALPAAEEGGAGDG